MIHLNERGFVLPSVLAFIAVMMAIILIGAGALERAREVTLALQSDRDLQSALDDMESQAVFTYLTSPPVRYGVSIGEGPRDAASIALGESDTGLAETTDARLWRADGGRIGFAGNNVRGVAEYRDTGGLISLNSSDPILIAALLESFGVDGDEAETMTARLRDYTDEDALRRPRGAERQDYRLRQMPPPADSPLRRVSEAGRVYGWEDFAPLGTREFLSLTTTASTLQDPMWMFSPPEIRALQRRLPTELRRDEDILSTASRDAIVPSGRARLTLMAFDEKTGRSRQRIVEITRTAAAAGAPYTRSLIFESPLPAGTAAPDIADIIPSDLLAGDSRE